MRRVILVHPETHERRKPSKPVESLRGSGSQSVPLSQSASTAASLAHMTLTAFTRRFKVDAVESVPRGRQSLVLALHGRALVKLSRQRHLDILKIPDARWGEVNSYDLNLLKEYFCVS